MLIWTTVNMVRRMSEESSDVIDQSELNPPREFQSDIRCSVIGHDVDRGSRYSTGDRLYGIIQAVACRRCNEILSVHVLRQPRSVNPATEQEGHE